MLLPMYLGNDICAQCNVIGNGFERRFNYNVKSKGYGKK